MAAGGCAQNTLKVMRWLLGKQCLARIFGSIGDDDEGELLKKILEEQGVDTNYVTQKGYSTGATLSLVINDNRSLIACLGAAEVLSPRHVTENLLLKEDIKKSDLVYIEGFFLTRRLEAAKMILNICKKYKKIIVFNTSGEYLCKEQPDVISYFIRNADIVFGNRREFEALYGFMGENSVELLLQSLGKSGKIVAMTNGPFNVVYLGKQCGEIEVPPMDKDDIVDTTGAGDSFVAGFLVGYILKKPLKSCSEIGCYAAQEIIKKRGCIVPNYPPQIVL